MQNNINNQAMSYANIKAFNLAGEIRCSQYFQENTSVHSLLCLQEPVKKIHQDTEFLFSQHIVADWHIGAVDIEL